MTVQDLLLVYAAYVIAVASPGPSNMAIMNAAMRRVKICGPQETPILNCRVNTKFAFIELVNAEMANKALNLNDGVFCFRE